jgi:signal transduction histidine kinase/ligand-binding sensor domain-containing protein
MSRVVLATALVLAAAPGRALDPHRAPSQYVIAQWGTGQLPARTVYALLQTPDRYLWLGTDAGLVRFDGARFVLTGSKDIPGFGDGGVRRLAPTGTGAFFVGTTSGTVLRYEAGAFQPFFAPNTSGAVVSLHAARDGSLWLKSMGSATRYYPKAADPTTFTIKSELHRPPVFAEDGEGRLWAASYMFGLSRYQDGVRGGHLPIGGDVFQCMAADRSGVIWIGTPHGLLRVEGTRVRRFTQKDGLSSDDVTAVHEDRDGNLWVGTRGGGLSRLANGRWSTLTSAHGLADDDVHALLEDHEGNLWVGTADGLCSLASGRFMTFGRAEGLPESAVVSVAPSSDGRVWAGTAAGSVVKLGAGPPVHVRLPHGSGSQAVLSLHEAESGALFIVLDDMRLFRFEHGTLTRHEPARHDARPLVGEDEHGVFYFRQTTGFERVSPAGGRAAPDFGPDVGRLGFPHCLARGGGALWLGSTHGLTRIGAGGRRTYTTADGLPDNRVRWIQADGDELWLATASGLALFGTRTGRVRRVTTEHGLPENYLRLVLDDGLGYLWIGSAGHIFRLEKSEVRAVLDGKASRLSPLLFDGSDGLRTTAAVVGNAPGFRARDGRLWFATAKGVAVVDPSRVPTSEPAPAMLIEGVRVDQASSAAVPAAAYPSGRGETTIDYTALGYAAPSKIRFRHKLDGLDRDWQEVGTSRRAYYSTLPAGRYRFSVMASNRDGAWNGPVVSFGFVLEPPFYRTTWFYSLCAVAVAAAAAAAHRLRVRQMRARFDAIIHERTRIARELHDTLAQGLAGAKLQVERACATVETKPDLAVRTLQQASAMLSSTLSEVRRSIWVLRAQAAKGDDGVGATLSRSLRQLTADTRLESSLRVTGRPRALHVEVEHNLLRIAHEAVTNAVRHSGAAKVGVELEFAEESLLLRVRDDGHGFDAGQYLQGGGGEHFGLVGMAERTQAVGGELQVKSADGAGTEVLCRLPYDYPEDADDRDGGATS